MWISLLSPVLSLFVLLLEVSSHDADHQKKNQSKRSFALPHPPHSSSLFSSSFTSSSHHYSTECDHVFMSSATKSQQFTSPAYPSSYPFQIECRYIMQGVGKERIQLEFIDFDLFTAEEKQWTKQPDCDSTDDVLTVFVVIDGTAKELAKNCGKHRPHSLMSIDNRLEVTFTAKSPERTQAAVRGFKAMFTFVTDFGIKTGIQDSSMACGFEYRSSSAKNGTFTSPNYPGLYPRNTECHYIFYGNQFECIHITFKTFDVEGIPPSCNGETQSDYVEFSNFNVELMDRKMSRICGDRHDLKKIVTSDGNFFRVTFKSNDVFDSTGFEAFYQFKKIEADPMSVKQQKSASGELHAPFQLQLQLQLLLLLLAAFLNHR